LHDILQRGNHDHLCQCAGANGAADEDMDIEEGEAPNRGLLPPPPPPPLDGQEVGPARPVADDNASNSYADPAAYEAYVQSNVAYQVRALPDMHSRVHMVMSSSRAAWAATSFRPGALVFRGASQSS